MSYSKFTRIIKLPDFRKQTLFLQSTYILLDSRYQQHIVIYHTIIILSNDNRIVIFDSREKVWIFERHAIPTFPRFTCAGRLIAPRRWLLPRNYSACEQHSWPRSELAPRDTRYSCASYVSLCFPHSQCFICVFRRFLFDTTRLVFIHQNNLI